jgi:cytochrome P450
MSSTIAVPMAPGALPLLGHAVALLRDPLGFLRSMPDYGDLVGLRAGPVTAVLVCDPLLTTQMLRNDRVFDKGGLIYDRIRDQLGSGLATCPHVSHRRRRRLLQPAFHASRFPGYTETMSAEVGAMTRSWKADQVLEVVAEATMLSARITMMTMFSQELATPLVREAVDDLSVVVARVFQRLFVPRALDRLPTRRNRRYQASRARLHRTLGAIIADRRASGRDYGDLLSAVLTARDNAADGTGLSDAEVIDDVLTFFTGGTETVATALAWALHLLATHPDIEARLHAEVDAVLGGRPATYADLAQLRLTRQIFMEALRLWPPAWILTRVAAEDTELGGYPISAGTTVVFSPYLIHHRADVYADPERFDPDRWAGTTSWRDSFVTFGGGARICIGDQFGITEAVVALATIAARWRLAPLPGQQVRPGYTSTLHPRGLRIRVVARAPLTSGSTSQ